jgi:DNA-binding TFAR19-related protein (PDSD5 family)
MSPYICHVNQQQKRNKKKFINNKKHKVMRTNLFLVAVLAGMLSLTSVNANSKTLDNARIEMAQQAVENTLQQMFMSAPIEDYIESEETVQIFFSVNENSEITNIKVLANNFELENYVYQVLTENKIVLGNVAPDNYNVNLVFDIK